MKNSVSMQVIQLAFQKAGVPLSFRCGKQFDGGDCDCSRGDRAVLVGFYAELVTPFGQVVGRATSTSIGLVDEGTFWAASDWQLVG